MKKYLHAILFLLAVSDLPAQSYYKLVNTFHVASPGGWDYPAVDVQNGKLYLSHGSQVNILNARTGDSLGVITGTSGVHGIAFAHELGKGYTSNGRLNNVTVFDLKTGSVLGEIGVGKNPDWILYEPKLKRIITSNHTSGDISLIDPSTDQVVSTISLDGATLETIVSDGEGRLYVNAEDKREIDVVDVNAQKVVARWPLGVEGPTGLAIDTKQKRLFSTCDKQLVVVDATNGRIVAKLPIGNGCDGAVFDTDNHLVFTSNGEGTITVVKQLSKDEYKVLETLHSKRGARTIAIDQANHTLFLPTADYEPVPDDAPVNTRPRMVSGSFQVLVFKK